MRVFTLLGLVAAAVCLTENPAAFGQSVDPRPPRVEIADCCKEFRCPGAEDWTIVKGSGSTMEEACQAAYDNAVEQLGCINPEVRDIPSGPLGTILCESVEGDSEKIAIASSPCPRCCLKFTFYFCGDEPRSILLKGANYREAYCKGLEVVRRLQNEPSIKLCKYCWKRVPCK